jgi:outer membrane immunogenic protein
MKNLLLSGVAIAAITVAVSEPAKAVPPATYSWTGCYIGGNFGGSTADKTFFADAGSAGAGSAHSTTAAGGGQLGCDFQAGVFVFGVQGMFDWTNMQGRSLAASGKGYTFRTPWFSTAAGRVGYLATPNTLFFVKGGAAWAGDKYQFVENFGAFTDDTAHETRRGWVLSGGVDWMVVPNWSISVEYGTMSFGTRPVSFQSTLGPGGFTNRIDQHVQFVLVGLNYHFSSWGGARP